MVTPKLCRLEAQIKVSPRHDQARVTPAGAHSGDDQQQRSRVDQREHVLKELIRERVDHVMCVIAIVGHRRHLAVVQAVRQREGRRLFAVPL